MTPDLSILIPFSAPHGSDRAHIWKWTHHYWRHAFPDAEIIIGHDRGGPPYSKSAAVNDAASRAHGRIYAILDADVYLRAEDLTAACSRIAAALERGRHLWMIPFRRFYRLTKPATKLVLHSDPRDPYRFSSPPPYDDVEHVQDPWYGHHYGAMALIVPAEGFWAVGGMDPRFRGWGGEDVSFLFALDTLYGPHYTVDADILHLYHHRIGGTWKTSMWEGQDAPLAWAGLGGRFHSAYRDPEQMRALVDEGLHARLP